MRGTDEKESLIMEKKASSGKALSSIVALSLAATLGAPAAAFAESGQEASASAPIAQVGASAEIPTPDQGGDVALASNAAAAIVAPGSTTTRYYDSLSQAVSDWARAGGTLQLLSDGEVVMKQGSSYLTQADCTLDLNGHTLEFSGTAANNIKVGAGFTLTIDDGSGSGKGILGSWGTQVVVTASSTSSIVLNSGSIKVKQGAYAVRAHNFTMNGGQIGGEFYGGPSTSLQIFPNGTATINAGKISKGMIIEPKAKVVVGDAYETDNTKVDIEGVVYFDAASMDATFNAATVYGFGSYQTVSGLSFSEDFRCKSYFGDYVPAGQTCVSYTDSDGETYYKVQAGQSHTSPTVETVADSATGGTITTATAYDGTTVVVKKDVAGAVTSTAVAVSEAAVENANGAPVSLPLEVAKDMPIQVSLPESSQPVVLSFSVEGAQAATVVKALGDAGESSVVSLSMADEGRMVCSLPSDATIVATDAAKAFRDTVGIWAQSAIDFASSHNMFQGIGGSDVYDPEGAMTRDMLFTVLARTAGVDTSAADGADWAAPGRAWAVEAKVSNGEDGEQLVTREQLVTMLFRYAQTLGCEEGNRADLSAFADAGGVSEWAEEAVQWAVDEGILRGVDDAAIDPQGFATRAQAAAFMQRFVKSALL